MSFAIDISEEAGVRYLHFGSEWIQGAMRIARPWNLELEYTREMMAALILREGGGKAAGYPPAYSSRVLRDEARWPRKVLLIGLGAASLTKFLYRHYPLAHLTVVEIEPAVIAAARQYFRLPEDPRRIEIVTGDGVEYVLGTAKKFDLVLVDGYDEHARSGALETLRFYQACRACLGRAGIVAINLLTGGRGFNPTVARLASAFDDRALVFPSCESGNAIAVAAAGDPVELSFDELKQNALALKQQTGLNLLPALARLARARTCLNDRLVL